jgi:hypothetical protein
MKKRIIFSAVLLFCISGCASLNNFMENATNYDIAFPDGSDKAQFTRYVVPQVPFETIPFNNASFDRYSINLNRNGLKRVQNNSGFYTKTVSSKLSEQYPFTITGSETWKGECVSQADYYYKSSGLFWETTLDSKDQCYLHATATSASGSSLELNMERSMDKNAKEIPPFSGFAQRGKPN